MKSDHPSLALLNRWCPKVSARSEASLHELSLSGRFALEIKLHHLLALRHDDTSRVSEDAHQVLLSEALFARVHCLTDSHIPAGEELVSAGAARSAFSVVVPVNALRHEILIDAFFVTLPSQNLGTR